LDRFIVYALTPEGINTYLNGLTCGNGKHNYFRCIKTLCRWLYQNSCISSNPIEKVSPPRRQKKLLPAISKKKLQTLLKHSDNHKNPERDKAILSLLWYSGMRLSEVANVKADDPEIAAKPIRLSIRHYRTHPVQVITNRFGQQTHLWRKTKPKGGATFANDEALLDAG